MKLLILVILLFALFGCTTFSMNQNSVSKACKSGVSEYDDGGVAFKCFDKTKQGDKK